MPIAHVKITYVLIGILFVALGGMFYQNHKLQAALQAGAPLASTAPAPEDVTVGSAPATSNIFGNIVDIESTSMTIRDQASGASYAVSITADTKVQLDGAMKDQETRQKELAAYNAQVQTLMEDPVKNKAALAALQVPPVQIVTAGSLADLKPGDFVMVGASSVSADNVYVAALISKPVAQTQ